MIIDIKYFVVFVLLLLLFFACNFLIFVVFYFIKKFNDKKGEKNEI